jgi:hypothetical protein
VQASDLAAPVTHVRTIDLRKHQRAAVSQSARRRAELELRAVVPVLVVASGRHWLGIPSSSAIREKQVHHDDRGSNGRIGDYVEQP